jgi:hypothetical protein
MMVTLLASFIIIVTKLSVEPFLSVSAFGVMSLRLLKMRLVQCAIN